MPKAGLEIGVDLKSLKAELALANAEFRKFNENAIKNASSINTVEAAANKAGKSTGGFFKQMALANVVGTIATRALGIVGNALGGFARGTIQASSSLTELNSKAMVVYGQSFPAIQQKTSDIAREVGRASSAILGMATDMGAVIKSFGLAGEPMERMSTELAKLAIDMASFSNATDEEAFAALRSGITGETEPLKRFGVVLTDANLQIFAMEKGIKKKVSAMNQAEKTVLRHNFIMQATADAQGDAARTADTFANQSRRLKGEITELQEKLGHDATPVMAAGLAFISDFLTNVFIPAVQTASSIVSGFVGVLGSIASHLPQGFQDLGNWGRITGSAFNIKSSQRDLSIEDVQAAVAMKKNRPLTPEEMRDFNLKNDMKTATRGGVSLGTGGGKSEAEKAAEKQKKLTEDMEKAEKGILQAVGDQAKANKDRLDTERDILQAKKDMGTATKAELIELERINIRVDYQKEKVGEATDAWEKQRDVVKTLKEDLEELNKEPIKLRQELDKTLADIDRDTAQRKIDKATELTKKKNELEARMGGALGLSGGESDEYADVLNQLRGIDEQTRLQADRNATLDPFQSIDEEGKQKKLDATRENAAKLEEATLKIADKTTELADAQALLKDRVDAVTQAIAEQTTKNAATYALVESATKIHVANETAEWLKLEAQLRAVSAAYGKAGGVPSTMTPSAAYATGGPVSGPGTGTSDSIIARLSHGEHVLTAADVRALGGQSAVLSFRELLHSMPKFASGGPVNNSRKVVNNFYHSSSANPQMVGWHTKRAIR